MMLSTSDPYTVPDFDVELAVLNFWGSLRFAPTLTQTHLHHGAQTGRYAWTEWLDELNWWLCNVFRGMSRGFQIFCCGKPVMNPILDPHSGEFSRAHRGSSIFFLDPKRWGIWHQEDGNDNHRLSAVEYPEKKIVDNSSGLCYPIPTRLYYHNPFQESPLLLDGSIDPQLTFHEGDTAAATSRTLVNQPQLIVWWTLESG